MKRLWIELQRWNKQRVVICRECGPLIFGQKVRAPLAYHAAAAHRSKTHHKVKTRRSCTGHALQVRRRG